jgi:hypothetical protein
MIASTMSLADTLRHFAVDGDRHRSRPHLRQRLRGQDVLDLTRADAERQRAERAVRRGVAVAAHDGHARLRETLLRPDDVHDALARIAHPVEPDAELFAVAGQHVHLLRRDRIGQRQVEAGGRHVVVHRRDREIGPPYAPSRGPQAVERLRRRHFVDEMQVDVQEIGLIGGGVDDVAIPELLGQCLGGQGLGGLRHALLLSQ